MDQLTHRAPSVGAVIKKISEIYPQLTAQEMIGLIRQSIQSQGQVAGEFASAEVIDEAKVLRLAQIASQQKL
jgi:hypothetical protein